MHLRNEFNIRFTPAYFIAIPQNAIFVNLYLWAEIQLFSI